MNDIIWYLIFSLFVCLKTLSIYRSIGQCVNNTLALQTLGHSLVGSFPLSFIVFMVVPLLRADKIDPKTFREEIRRKEFI